jgi:phage recombination protein Bet
MSNIEVVENKVILFNKEQVELIKRTIAKDATDDELNLFINQCRRTGLDPMTRQIYFIKDKNGKVTVCSSIDGLRLVAERSDKYEGQTKAEWCGSDGVWKDIWLSNELPSAARVGVYKNKFRDPVYGVAIFEEYAGRYSFDDKYGKFKKGDLTFMWSKMPALMIAKVAEALALRKAFPNDLSGIYSSEEAEKIIPETETKPEQLKEPPKEPIKSAVPVNFNQQKELTTLANQLNMVNSVQKEMRTRYGAQRTSDLLVWQYEELIKMMREMK